MIRSLLLAAAVMAASGAALADESQVDLCRTRSDEILHALQKGDYATARTHFDARMQAGLDAQKLGQVWQQILPQKLGTYDHAEAANVRQANDHPIAETPLHFANGWLSMRVSCDDSGKVDGLFFIPGQPPVAAEVDMTHEQPLSVPSPLGPLPGTLTLPTGNGPFPVVLLVAGSGPNDRDETIGPNKPFRDLAQGLAAAGIASLRYDKRTHVYGPQMAADQAITVDDEVTDDAVSALHLLATRAHIDPARMFVLGHSLGALMAPRIGQRDSQVAGLILLAAPATFDLDLVLRQINYIGHVQGADAAVMEKQTAPIIAARNAMAHADPAHPPAGMFFHAPASYWLSLRNYNAVNTAKTLRMPMLVLQGARDYQVTAADEFAQWQAAFAHDPRVKLSSYPGLGHLFMPAGDPPSPADYAHAGHVDAQVIRDITAWILNTPANTPTQRRKPVQE
ncbi:MAG: serine aminopeptidase domain-containing protein [Rhodanobacter sp.]